MSKQKSEIKFKRVTLRIKNAHIEIASGITHQLYQMVDDKELHSISIDNVRKSEHSVEMLIGIGIFISGYVASKIIDMPVNHVLQKIRMNLLRWKYHKKQKKLDFFFDGERLE